MTPAGQALIVWCTCPDPDTADNIAAVLVGRRLAACVNQVPGIVSTYIWEGRLERNEETLLMIKTRAPVYPELETALRALHPYELPEILAVPVTRGLSDYLAWIDAATTPEA